MLLTTQKLDSVVESELSSLFPYHIPKDATYSASDMINMLNSGYRHAILAKSSDPLYSLGTAFDAFFPPTALFGIGITMITIVINRLIKRNIEKIGKLLLLGSFGVFFAISSVYSLQKQLNIPTTAPITHDICYGNQKLLIAEHYCATLKVVHHRRGRSTHLNWSYYLANRQTIQDEKFTANEVAYLFNTHDVYTVLNHKVEKDYASKLTGSSWLDRVIMVDDPVPYMAD